MANAFLKDFIVHSHADYSSNILQIIQREDIDLVLLNMKGAHSLGMGLCEKIRGESAVSIILMGGSNDFYLARQALAFHVSDYLVDPVDPEEFYKSLKTVKCELDSKYRSYSQSETDNEISLKTAAMSSCSIINAIKQFVQEQLHQNITLKKISDSLSFNCAYLGQKFKQHENMTFNEYLLQQRMEKAKRLLETTDMKIYEIAGAVGYTEIDWFYKKFKEHAGASANEYRKQCFISA